jgi:hypothetical protein
MKAIIVLMRPASTFTLSGKSLIHVRTLDSITLSFLMSREHFSPNAKASNSVCDIFQ